MTTVEKHQCHHHNHHHNKDAAKPDHLKSEKHHKHLELIGQAGAVAAGGFAMHEKHKAKKDPENAHGHKIKQEIAVTIAVGSAGFAMHERHEKKQVKKDAKADARHAKKTHL